MKYTLLNLSIILLLLSCNENAENNNQVITAGTKIPVPDAVISAFNEKFTDGEIHNWKMIRGLYEVEFEQGGKLFEAEFDKDGDWVYTEWIITKDDLPDSYLEKIESTYDNFEIKAVEQQDHKTCGKVYEVDIETVEDGKSINVEMLFTEKGKVFKIINGNEEDPCVQVEDKQEEAKE